MTHAGILQEAMGKGEYWRLIDSQGRPPGLLGMWPSRAVSFIENHDTGEHPALEVVLGPMAVLHIVKGVCAARALSSPVLCICSTA